MKLSSVLFIWKNLGLEESFQISAINHVAIIMMMLTIIRIIIIALTRIVKTLMDQGSKPTNSN